MKTLIIIGLLMASGSPLMPWHPCPALPVSVMETAAPDFRQDILSQTNAARKQRGLAALVLNDALNQLAQEHSERMAANKVPFSHNGFQQRYDAARRQLGNVGICGENVAYGSDSVREIMQGWMKSKGHRENILGRYTLIGIGAARSDDGHWYYTQFFCAN